MTARENEFHGASRYPGQTLSGRARSQASKLAEAVETSRLAGIAGHSSGLDSVESTLPQQPMAAVNIQSTNVNLTHRRYNELSVETDHLFDLKNKGFSVSKDNQIHSAVEVESSVTARLMNTMVQEQSMSSGPSMPTALGE